MKNQHPTHHPINSNYCLSKHFAQRNRHHVGSVVRWCPPPFRDMTGITSAPSFGHTLCRCAQGLKANSHRLAGTIPRPESHRLRRIKTSHGWACQRIVGICGNDMEYMEWFPLQNRGDFSRISLRSSESSAAPRRYARIPLTGLSSWNILTTLRTWAILMLPTCWS